VPDSSVSPAPKKRTSADSWQTEKASLESCLLSLICPWHCSHRGTETGAACLSCHLKLQTYLRWFVTGASANPALKMRTSADNWQPERASPESCCSASSAHGTARTEAQRLGLLACLTPQTSDVSLGVRAGHIQQSCCENANVCR